MFTTTCSILSNVINNGATFTQRADANEVYDMITSFEFVFILHLMRDIMGTIDDLYSDRGFDLTFVIFRTRVS